MENINLLGSEDVLRAANTIKAAANSMSTATSTMSESASRMEQAAATIDNSNHQFLARYEDLLYRMERAAEKMHDRRSIFAKIFGTKG